MLVSRGSVGLELFRGGCVDLGERVVGRSRIEAKAELSTLLDEHENSQLIPTTPHAGRTASWCAAVPGRGSTNVDRTARERKYLEG